jgi:hypothetical protein
MFIKFCSNVALVFAAQLLGVGLCMADDYPYVGYFTYQSEKPKPNLMQAKCARMFYKQNADGSGINYILDERTYEASGEVKYVVFAENWCAYNAAENTNFCKQKIYDDKGTSDSESYDVLRSEDKDSFSNVFFLTSFELRNYVKDTTKAIPSWQFPTATPIYSERCIGFDDQTLLGHLSPVHSELGLEALEKIMNRAVDEQTFPAILDIMQNIGSKAAQATLPGQ